MRYVNMNGFTKDVQLAQANSLAAKPISVLDTMNVAVDRPCMEQRSSYPVLGKNAQSGSKYTTNQLQTIRF